MPRSRSPGPSEAPKSPAGAPAPNVTGRDATATDARATAAAARERRAPATRQAEVTAEAEPLVTGLPASLLSPEQLRSAVESVLFVAGRSLELAELRRLLLVEEPRLREAIAALAEECELHGRGVRVLRTGDAVQFVSAPENARFVAALLGLPTQVKLTTAALETLAVVAYRQPITRSQVEFIRGVNSDRALASLIQHGLVIEMGRAAAIGRPALFGTTAEFLQQFGLSNIEALPTPDLSETEAAEIARRVAAQAIRASVGETDTSAVEPPTEPSA